MSTRSKFVVTFEAENVIQPVYTGGAVALDKTGSFLATTLDEEALLTDLNTGKLLARVEGVGCSKSSSSGTQLNVLVGWRATYFSLSYVSESCYNDFI